MHQTRNTITIKLIETIGLVILALSTLNQVYAQPEFSKLVVFGDSLSDTGNLAIVDLPAPYFDNRISNGPVLADLIALEIGANAERSGHLLGSSQGFNYAVSGGNILGSDPEDLSLQISAYLQRVGGTADPNALYLVFMGGNDIRGLRSQPSLGVAQSQIASIVARLELSISRLVDAGARTFIVPNVANIGRIPETLMREAQEPGTRARAEFYTQRYNTALSQMLQAYQQDERLTLVEFDLFSAFELVLNEPARFGFNSVTEGCFDPSSFDVELECLLFGFERRAFFDQLHPSSATNQIIFDSLKGQIPSPTAAVEQNNGLIAAILALLLAEN